MKCKICKSNRIEITYKGCIRNGGVGNYTEAPVIMWKCEDCGVIWHDSVIDNAKEFYESEEYRNSVNGSSDAELFYELYDKNSLEKFSYTGTDIFRNKKVADIGCGPGAFLDFLRGVADTVIAVEPSLTYRTVMEKKGYQYLYAYADEAKNDWKGRVDIITSFDVIEHVENPKEFLADIFELLSEKGMAVIGTPTEAPVMRRLLGNDYEKQVLFSTQHIWSFSGGALKIMAGEAGFSEISVRYEQRYGLENLLGWLKTKKPCSDIEDSVITKTLDMVYKTECKANGLADYVVLYAYKR